MCLNPIDMFQTCNHLGRNNVFDKGEGWAIDQPFPRKKKMSKHLVAQQIHNEIKREILQDKVGHEIPQ